MVEGAMYISRLHIAWGLVTLYGHEQLAKNAFWAAKPGAQRRTHPFRTFLKLNPSSKLGEASANGEPFVEGQGNSVVVARLLEDRMLQVQKIYLAD